MPEEKTVVHSLTDLMTQAKRTSACFIVVSGRSTVGKMFKLDRPEMTIGRSADADIMLDDEGVSRRHAKVVVKADGSVQLVDLNSTNGTFNNGDKIDVSTLHDGDKIQIGSATILKFSLQDSIEEAMTKNLYESATRDGLTHIYNKKYFIDTLKKEFAYCVRHEVPLSLMIMDVDHFKRINDTYGHQVGDSVLTWLAAKINDAIRAEDVFARYGGEEFVLLLREVPEEKCFILAERLRRLVESTEFVYEGHAIRVTVSIGIAILTDEEFKDPDGFIAAADRRLYRAKQAGRNRVEARMVGG